jgi:hypothetical protein
MPVRLGPLPVHIHRSLRRNCAGDRTVSRHLIRRPAFRILDACHDEALVQTGSAFAPASCFRSKKLNDRLSRFLRPFFQNPMAGVFQDHNRDIGGYQLHLFCKFVA